MEGFVFYWLSWSGWIYVTFILSKTNQYRFNIAFSLLCVIILSSQNVTLFQYNISLVAFYLLSICYLIFIKNTFWKLFVLTIKIIIITFSGATFFLLSLFDPVWIFVDLYWIQGLLFTCLAIVLFSHFKERLFASVVGLIQAEFLYAFLLKQWNISYSIASLKFLDSLALTSFLITIWFGVEQLQYLFQKNYNVEKEKQL